VARCDPDEPFGPLELADILHGRSYQGALAEEPPNDKHRYGEGHDEEDHYGYPQPPTAGGFAQSSGWIGPYCDCGWLARFGWLEQFGWLARFGWIAQVRWLKDIFHADG
jgi:hypothetical protein